MGETKTPAKLEKAKDAMKSIEFGPSMIVGVVLGVAATILLPKIKAKLAEKKG